MMSLRKVIGKIHLWLGLASGLIVFMVGLTGCLLVFEEEICSLLNYGVFRHVVKQETRLAPPSAIFAAADSVLKGKGIAREYYTVYLNEPRVNTLWALDSSRQYSAVLQNPYTAEIIGTYDYSRSFFAVVTYLHMTLGLGDVGTEMVSYGTLIFVVLMITGIILWKPANKKGYRQRFTIKWNAKAKRLSYDLHNVFGFYMTWVAIFIALTGLIWSFEWMNNTAQWLANGGKTITTERQNTSSDTTSKLTNFPYSINYEIVDSIFSVFVARSIDIRAIQVHKPSSVADIWQLIAETRQGASYLRTDKYCFDQYSGKLLAVQKFADMSNGEKLRHMNYYIHVGSIGGLTGKLLAFFASLIATSLPVTGFIIWKGRAKRTKISRHAYKSRPSGKN